MVMDQTLWKRLSEQISSEDVKIRAAAIEELGNLPEIQSIRLLLKALTDISAQNRQRAGQLLIQRQHPAVLSGLISLLDSDKFHIRTSAASLIDQIPSDVARKHIQDLLDDPQLESSLRISLIGLFCRHADETMIPRITQFLQDPSNDVKKACLSGLDRASGDWIISYLTVLMQSDDVFVAQEAAQNLMRREPSPEMIRQLLPLLKIPGHTGDQAVSILSRTASESNSQLIVPMLQNPDPLIRRRSLLLLSSILPNEILDHAVPLMTDSDEELRQTALNIIVSRPVESVIDHLLTASVVTDALCQTILSSMQKTLDDPTLIGLLETHGPDRFGFLLKNRDIDRLLEILADRMDTSDHGKLSRHLQIIGRMGRSDGLNRLPARDIPESSRDQYGRIVMEIGLREDCAAVGFDHIRYSLADLVRMASENGWNPGIPIDQLFDALYRKRDMHQRRQELLETLRRNEKAQMELQIQLDRLDQQRTVISRRNRIKAAMLLMLAAGVVCAIICLVQNFRNPNGLWYSGFFLSVCLMGISILILRKQIRTLPFKASAHPSRPREMIEQQLSFLKESLADVREEIDSYGSGHGGEELTSFQTAVNELPHYLVKNP